MLTEETIQDKIEVVGDYKHVQVRTAVVIKRDGTEISRSFSRHVLAPCTSSKDSDDKWTHTDTDISAEATEVQAVANAVWTDTVKANYKTFVESQEV
jgi:hypothetical protein